MANTIPIEFEGVSDEVIFKLIQRVDAKDLLAKQQAEHHQRLAASEIGEHRAMDGLGRLRLSVNPVAFHYWGRRLGYECWRDKQFLREFERDNASVRVKQAGGTRLQVGYAAEPKFRKAYG